MDDVTNNFAMIQSSVAAAALDTSTKEIVRLERWVRSLALRIARRITGHARSRGQSASVQVFSDRSPPMTMQPLAPGEHIATPRRVYVHHGIYIGNGQVVHYRGLARGLRGGPVEVVALETFTLGHALWRLLDDSPRFRRDEVVSRALSRVGEDRYHVLKNNCEHFCAWCMHGEHRSQQIDRWLARPRRAVQMAQALIANLVGVGSKAAGVEVRLESGMHLGVQSVR